MSSLLDNKLISHTHASCYVLPIWLVFLHLCLLFVKNTKDYIAYYVIALAVCLYLINLRHI